MKSDLEEMAILRISDVKRLTGLCRSSIYQMMAAGKFPRAVSIGSRAVGWMVRDIRAWLQERNFATV